ncbi:hypothetical protein JW960_16140 [candidate division KSB1 bacterium]|nr:hypothetical protein [candidate division KSB1 bacterium]
MSKHTNNSSKVTALWRSAEYMAHSKKRRHPLCSMRSAFLLTVMLFGLVDAVLAQKPTAEQIMTHVREQMMSLRDYTVEIQAVLDMPDIQIPPMDVKVYFKQPDKFHVESDGFSMLPRQGLFLNPNMWQDSLYFMVEQPEDTLGGKTVIPVELIPKSEESQVRKLTLWISPEHWTVEKVYTIAWDGRKATARFTNQLIDKKYWLPTYVRVVMPAIRFRGNSELMKVPGDDGTPNEEKPKEGTLVVEFKKYKINTGLKDDIFEQK